MKSIKLIKSCLVLSILLVGPSSHAITVDDVTGMFGNGEPAGPCTKERKIENIHLNYGSQQLLKQAERWSEQQQYCKAIVYSRKAMALADNAQEMSTAWKHLIESAFNQRDYAVQLSETREFLKTYAFNAFAERVHYLAVKAVFENIELSEGRDPAWIQESLGVATGAAKNANDEELQPPQVNFSLKGFLEKYPDSYYKHEIEAMLNDIKNLIADRVIADAAKNHATRNYVPAIVQLQLLVQQGPGLAQFSKALYVMIRVIETFTYAVLRPSDVPSDRLARWLNLPVDAITEQKRQEVSQQLLEQAKKLSQMMVEKIPNDPWTKKMLTGL